MVTGGGIHKPDVGHDVHQMEAFHREREDAERSIHAVETKMKRANVELQKLPRGEIDIRNKFMSELSRLRVRTLGTCFGQRIG